MKKTIVFFSVVILALLLNGCGKPVGTPPERTPETIPILTRKPVSLPTPTPAVNDLDYFKEKSIYDMTAALTSPSLFESYEKYFLIGCGLTGSSKSTLITKSKEMKAIMVKHYNSTTFTNMMKPSNLLLQSGCKKNAEAGSNEVSVSFANIVESLNFLRDTGIKLRGHTLVWHNQVPDWFFREGFTDSGAYVSRDVMLVRLENYIKTVMTYMQTNYPGLIYSWDVVNEAIVTKEGAYDDSLGYTVRTKYGDSYENDNPWYTTIGADYVEKSFEYARKYADDNVKLIYNDFNTFQNDKRENICKLVQSLKEKGYIDGVGMQMYISVNSPSINDIKTTIQSFSDLGVEVQITELTCNVASKSEKDMNALANRYTNLFRMLASIDSDNNGTANITSVTFFGIMDENMFAADSEDYSRLFDVDLQPKKAFTSLLELMQN